MDPSKIFLFVLSCICAPCSDILGKFVGCFRDNQNNRVLSVGPLAEYIDECCSRCLSDGYRYSGYQNQNECWCGNDGEDYKK